MSAAPLVLALVVVSQATAVAAGEGPVRAGHHALAVGHTPAAAAERAYNIQARKTPGKGLAPDDALLKPSWWSGSCDGGSGGGYPGSSKNGAVFDGLPSCGPSPNQGGSDHLVRFFPGAWGEYEWECVELSMRWMYQAWGVSPYGANGNTVVANYPQGQPGYPRLQTIANGTPHAVPQPGDVLSINNADQFGHTEVVARSSVNSKGNGTLKAETENWGSGNGFVGLTVSRWVVTDNVPGDTVLGWLHDGAWSLQQPIVWDVTSAGVLQVKDTGSLHGPPADVASGIASAQVVGGEGLEPAPLVAALTTSGRLEAGYLLPNTPLRSVAPAGATTAVVSYAISSGNGRTGQPVLAWVTSDGALHVAAGAVTKTPVTLLGSGVAKVVLAAGSGRTNSLIGVLTTAGSFEVASGNLTHQPVTWTTVATGASQIGLAGGGGSTSQALEAYVAKGTLYERQGTSGPFSNLAGNVRQFSVATVGPSATPLVADVTNADVLAAKLGANSWVRVSDNVQTASVSGGPTTMGFPMLAYLNDAGQLWAKQGTLNSSLVAQPTGVAQGGGSELTVS